MVWDATSEARTINGLHDELTSLSKSQLQAPRDPDVPNFCNTVPTKPWRKSASVHLCVHLCVYAAKVSRRRMRRMRWMRWWKSIMASAWHLLGTGCGFTVRRFRFRRWIWPFTGEALRTAMDSLFKIEHFGTSAWVPLFKLARYS